MRSWLLFDYLNFIVLLRFHWLDVLLKLPSKILLRSLEWEIIASIVLINCNLLLLYDILLVFFFLSNFYLFNNNLWSNFLCAFRHALFIYLLILFYLLNLMIWLQSRLWSILGWYRFGKEFFDKRISICYRHLELLLI